MAGRSGPVGESRETMAQDPKAASERGGRPPSAGDPPEIVREVSDPHDHADLDELDSSPGTMGAQRADADVRGASESRRMPVSAGPAFSVAPAGEQDEDEEICHWAVLYGVTDLISAKTFDIDRTAASILSVALRLTGGEAGFIAVHDEARELVVRAAHRVDPMAALEDPTVADLTREAMDGNVVGTRDAVGLGRAFVRPGPASTIVAPLKIRLRQRPGVTHERRRYPEATLVKQIGVLFVARAPNAPSSPDLAEMVRTYAEHATAMLINAELYHAATHDKSTGYANRRELENILGVEMTLAQHQNTPLGLIMVGIDDPRARDHELTRIRSDRVVERCARVIRSVLRDNDTCVRYGNQEFSIILPNADVSGVGTVAEKVRRAVADYPGFGRAKMTISAGGSVFPYHARGRDELVRKADQSLYLAKSEGGDRCVTWSRSIPNYAMRADRLMGIVTGEESRDYRNVMTLLDMIVAVNLITDRRKLLQRITDMMIELADSERGIVLLSEGETEGVRAVIAQDARMNEIEPTAFAQLAVDRSFESGEVICFVGGDGGDGVRLDAAVSGGGVLSGEDGLSDEQLEEALRALGVKSMICLPLPVQDRIVGVLYLDSKQVSPTFSESDLIFVRALARQIGTAIEASRLYESTMQRGVEVEEFAKRLTQKVEAQASELTNLEKSLSELKLKYDYGNIVGKSRPMREIFQLLDKITESNVPVLIQGETGTGKELIARALHYNGPRKTKAFVTVNCSAITETLLESELFGHVKGAFTGADQDKKGLFEQADGGTIFLDEIQDMSRGMQRELLRVIQESEIRRVGGKEIIKVDTRVISAVNRDLKELLAKGEFRQDLYFRLNVVAIELPPLRRRKEDIPLLVQHYLRDLGKREGRHVKIEKAALRKLLRHDWPGNVRELENCLEKTVLMLEGSTITEDEIMLDGEGRSGAHPSFFDMQYKEAKEAFLREYLCHVLTRNNGNVTRASQESGIVRSSFHKIMRKHNLNARDFYAVK